ncbi:enoyl-CoA hydratase/isomerase family protein [Verminephrobacter eiseniae]|uniref:Short chain enoyl-CoA hydratase n=1 Tax=Verminephrobacter eiseniae (strain EF01-2) TaxID=391735 RepID=A1WIW1_VEREI|nr:enoyl-CoA hydratase-related protein [Verminephrobacter eiseniae]ABM57568.1 short chain enoyl-CoA hydratase [Verminephrobacter eiseniae EF01-2]MCW5283189.1 crotonase [Verminephrobacter eiseniae]MCW5303505.1 crotonase [Verminephrobacter eiseniae]MCW8180498.1 crotonase [Verminephrobacter eiseniae]MCW8188299.1 crotonase [Verminephrobacter eiseniae]
MSAAPAALASVLYERRENVAIVTLNRPGRMNTLGGSMKPDLARAFFEYARADERVRAVLITGSGERAFCAGADIKERADQQTTGSDYFVAQKATHELLRNIEEFEKPVVAAINGVALGGGLEVALCCDIRLACDSARFGLPEVKLGVIPAAGGTQRLPRLIGQARAKELILTADLIDADTALRYGIVSRVLPQAELMPAAIAFAQRIAEHPPLAVRFAKRAINRGLQTDLDSGLEYERYAAAMVIDSADRKEGMRAFVEKRKPVFTGR